MPDTYIKDFFQVNNRFLRSVQIERDYNDKSVLDGYLVTPFVKTSFDRISQSLNHNSSQRAWRITGDYGCGKSSFALALAHMFSGESQRLPNKLQQVINFTKLSTSEPRLLPVLVTGARETISIALLNALKAALEKTCTRGRLPQIIGRIHSVIELSNTQSVKDKDVIGLLHDANSYIQSKGKGTGILIVLDELGKFLEYAAIYPDKQDIYFLQSLAEAAARSGETPLIVVGLLHQGFHAYVDQLSQGTQREWEKIAGRFEELLFNQPLEQTMLLVADVLNVRTDRLPKDIIKESHCDISAAIDLGWYGFSKQRKAIEKNATRIFPLHMTVIPVLIKLFHRFGQNERSLFSFLLSNEPFSLKAYSEQHFKPDCYYRIHNLYDYIRYVFGHRLSSQSYRSHWNQIESVVESFHSEETIELEIIKTIALLNLLDDQSLLASEEVIKLAVVGNNSSRRKRVSKALDTLQRVKRILYNRGAAGGFCLWPHTSVNLEKAYNEASKALELPKRVSSYIKDHLETRPVVARRHYIETGNLRYFEVRYVTIAEMQSAIDEKTSSADGVILIPLCETKEEQADAIIKTELTALKERPELLIAISNPLSNIAGLVQENRRWEWIAQNVPELNHDSYAAEEVFRQISVSHQILQKRINCYIGLRQFTETLELQWSRQGEKIEINNGRDLLSQLSAVCDEIYSQAPIIRNELINRKNISSAASAARLRLIDRMFKHASEPLIGMNPDKKPPEMSIYLSVLKASHLHSEDEGGIRFDENLGGADPCRLRPTFHRIMELLENNNESRIQISDLFSELRKPPYGVRDGLHPLLLSAFSIMHEHELAFYENGAFVQNISGDEVQRLIKSPEFFEVQLCRISGVRADVFNKMLGLLGINVPDNRKVDILDVVRPLCVFASQLPQYTLHTKNISHQSSAVRSALLKAQEPAGLLFQELPIALGFTAFDSGNGYRSERMGEFIGALKKCIDELTNAYPELLRKIEASVLSAFDIARHNNNPRHILTSKASGLLVAVNEPKLKSFCLRLVDAKLPEKEWLESLGSFVCSKPPVNWTDKDVDLFLEEILRLALRFKRVEALTFGAGPSEGERAVRVAITRQDGTELEKVVRISANEEKVAGKIQADIVNMFERNKNIGLAAASRAIWDELAKESSEPDKNR